MCGAPQKPVEYVADAGPDRDAPVRLADDEALIQEIPELPAEPEPGPFVGLPLSGPLDGVAFLVEGLVVLVQGNAVLEGVEGPFVRRAVEGDDPVGQPPLQDPRSQQMLPKPKTSWTVVGMTTRGSSAPGPKARVMLLGSSESSSAL